MVKLEQAESGRVKQQQPENSISRSGGINTVYCSFFILWKGIKTWRINPVSGWNLVPVLTNQGAQCKRAELLKNDGVARLVSFKDL